MKCKAQRPKENM